MAIHKTDDQVAPVADNAMQQAFNNVSQGTPSTPVPPVAPIPPVPPPQPQPAPMSNSPFTDPLAFGAPVSNGLDKWDWMDLNSMNAFMVNSSPSSQSLRLYTEAFKNHFDKSIADNLDVEFLPVDKGTVNDVHIAVINIIATHKTTGQSLLTYHSLLLESSIDPIPPRVDTLEDPNTREKFTVENMVLTSDIYDQEFRMSMNRYMMDRFPSFLCYPSGAEVINRDFELTEENIRSIVTNAILSCRSTMSNLANLVPAINLAQASYEKSEPVQSVISHHNTIQYDSAKNPVRADVIINTTAVPINSNGKHFKESKLISSVSGYMDMLYVNNNMYQQHQSTMFGTHFQPPANMQNTYVYQACFVITQMAAPYNQSLSGFLLSFINATCIRENDAWLYFLTPKHNTDQGKMHDIGNIGYDIDLTGERKFDKIPTTPDVFSSNDLAAIYQMFFHPGLSFALDIPECGAQTWMHAVFARAAAGLPEARDAIVAAADHLTNNNFSRIYREIGGDGSMVFEAVPRIHMGYYEAKDGKRDIRELDYLAVCGAVGKKNPQEIVSYTDTFTSNMQWNVALNTRRLFIETILGSVTYTGYGTRIMFEAKFLEALVRAAAACNYHVKPPQTQYIGNTSVRATANWALQGAATANTSGIFHQSFQAGAWSTGPRRWLS